MQIGKTPAKALFYRDIKAVDVREFMELGYLQELNRQFLHPLGMALEVRIKNGECTLGRIWDFRDDPEGVCLSQEMIDAPDTVPKAERVQQQFLSLKEAREKLFGSAIQPIPRMNEDFDRLEPFTFLG